MRVAAAAWFPAALLCASLSHAQCTEQWIPSTGADGVGGPVYAAMTADPDGPGPQGERLYFGGDFLSAGGAPVSRAAAWDGAVWQPLGVGTDGGVYALAAFGGEVIAGGTFASAGGVPCLRIARWNGASWQSLGSGITGASVPSVSALAVYGGALVASGRFDSAGGTPAANIARWDGASWQPLGLGLGPATWPTPGASALAVHGSELFSAGNFFIVSGGLHAHMIARCARIPIDLCQAEALDPR